MKHYERTEEVRKVIKEAFKTAIKDALFSIQLCSGIMAALLALFFVLYVMAYLSQFGPIAAFGATFGTCFFGIIIFQMLWRFLVKKWKQFKELFNR